MEFLDNLNESQREAVLEVDGPIMVIAGAGSGKTRVLTYRLAVILYQGLAYPQECLALTFTNKAAREMKERIFKLIGSDAKSLQMGTFHSIFSRVLRIEAEKIGFTSAYTIYDSDDTVRLIKTLLKEKRLDDKVFKPKIVANAISAAKNKLQTPAELKEVAVDDFSLKIAEIYNVYQDRCLRSNAMDFDDLLMKPIQLFRSHPEVLHKYQHRFKYILVDEYQDTNHAQYTLTKMLAAVNENICVVGDDAQSIYAFRGADIQNILNFRKDYPSAKIFKLEQNYRSTKNIVGAANSLIAKNKSQIPKKVFTQNEEGERIHIIEALSEQDEAKQVSSAIREQKQLYNFFNREFAILYRTNSQSRAIEDALRRSGLKYRVYGGLSFYQRKEIKDVVAYLRLAINPRDDQALTRVLNYPTRGIGKTSQERLIVYADQMNTSLWEALKRVDQSGLSSRVVKVVRDFTTMIESFIVIAQNQNAYQAANYIAKHSGILKLLHSDRETENLGRWENVQELLNAAQEFSENPDLDSNNLESFLADISLFTDQDKDVEDNDVITLMTIHSAKGLEFSSVFIVGMEENLFPSSMSLETRWDLEEERRLFYVAITRAKKYLILIHARSRYRFGNLQYNEPSRFLDELDADFIKRTNQLSGKFGGSNSAYSRRKPVFSERKKMSKKPQTSASIAFEPALPEEIVEGLTVYHPRFGDGIVAKVEGEGANRKATITFEEKGKRVLLLKFAKLQIK